MNIVCLVFYLETILSFENKINNIVSNSNIMEVHLYEFEQNNNFIIQPRGQTTHLRPIKYTPLERGDSIHNKKFQPHIIEPTVKS